MTEWPPKHLAPVTQKLAEWSAWLSGDRAQLETVNANTGGKVGFGGRVVRAWKRFWGAETTDPTITTPKIKVHVPLAADIARAGRAVLFAAPPVIVSTDQPTQDRITTYLDDGLIDTCAEAAEIGTGLGGVYLRVLWDYADKRVFVSRVDADRADPKFVFGRLQSVRFWHTIAAVDHKVWRHVEEYTVNDQGHGVTLHHLYEGTATDLGRQVPLTDRPETAALADVVDGDEVSSQTPGLSVVYIPNRTPNTLWRNDPAGCHLGLPDVYGSEDLLDRLDSTYSQLLRETDLSKARLIVPSYMLDVLGPGQGVTVDADRDIWAPVELPAPSEGQHLKPELVQPDIRVDKFLAIMQQLTVDILRASGYSTSTFGEDETGGSQTATEVKDRAGRTADTRAVKIRTWRPALLTLVRKMLAVDAALFGAQVDPDSVSVTFPEAHRTTPLENAQTVQLLASVGRISLYMSVKAAWPEWDDAQVLDEVARIEADAAKRAAAQAQLDPEVFGFGGTNLALPTGGDTQDDGEER